MPCILRSTGHSLRSISSTHRPPHCSENTITGTFRSSGTGNHTADSRSRTGPSRTALSVAIHVSRWRRMAVPMWLNPSEV